MTQQIFKVIMLGDTTVGKSSFVHSYLYRKPQEFSSITIGVEFGSIVEKVSQCTDIITNAEVKVQIWDTSGQERFRAIVSNYYRHSQGVVLMFDMCSRKSFENIEFWLNEFNKVSPTPWHETCLILVGNKADMTDNICITPEEVEKMATKLNVPYYIISGKKDCEQVVTIMRHLCKMFLMKHYFPPEKEGISFVKDTKNLCCR